MSDEMTTNNKKPEWINLNNFIEVLALDETQKQIAATLSIKCIPQQPGYTPNQPECQNLSREWLPSFLTGLRVFEIKDIVYWLVSFSGVFVFLICELLVLLYYNLAFSNSTMSLWVFFIAFLGLYCLYIIAFLYLRLEDKIQIKFFVNHLFTIPAVIASIGLMGLHFMLIVKSGWLNSPMLPAFVFVNLTIITAPRENSGPIVGLTLVGAIMVFAPYLVDLNVSVPEGDSKQFRHLSYVINALTLFFSVLIVFVSRFFSSKRIIR